MGTGVQILSHFGHRGVTEISVHLVAGGLLFVAGSVATVMFWRSFRRLHQGWRSIRWGATYIGLIGLGESVEHYFNGYGYNFFHYLHMISAPLALLLLYIALKELEWLYFELESKLVMSNLMSWLTALFGLVGIIVFSLASGGSNKLLIELTFLFLTFLPTIILGIMLIAKSISMYNRQYRLSLHSLVIFSTLLTQVPVLAVFTVLLSADIFFGRVSDQLRIFSGYVVFHVAQDVFLAATATILFSSAIMLFLSRDTRELQGRILQSAKLVALGELAANVAYKLQNPLTKILNTSSLSLKDLGPGHQLRQDLQEINIAATKAVNISKELLDFSRSTESRFQVTSLKQILDESLSLTEVRFRHENIRVVKKLQRPLPYLSVDRTQIKQAIVNVINNAIDAMPGGGRLEISAFTSDKWVQICFKDTGAGMSKEVQEKVFDPFFTTRSNNDGTGLGLPSALNIINSHGGKITIDSQPNAGTIVRIELPILENFRFSYTKEPTQS